MHRAMAHLALKVEEETISGPIERDPITRDHFDLVNRRFRNLNLIIEGAAKARDSSLFSQFTVKLFGLVQVACEPELFKSVVCPLVIAPASMIGFAMYREGTRAEVVQRSAGSC